MAEPEVVSADPNESGMYEIESLCMNCNDNGVTRILPITIPFFKQILLESFSCDHCGHKNTTVQNAGSTQEKGVKYTFRLDASLDLNRQVIKGDHAVFRFDDLGLDMPMSQGALTNVEGLINKASDELEQDQPQRKEVDFRTYTALNGIIKRLHAMRDGNDFPIHVTLDDPSGNSFITPSTTDSTSNSSKYTKTEYVRTHAQNIQLGLTTSPEPNPLDGVNILSDEVQSIPVTCPACTQPCTMNAHKTHIPHFRDVIIMATSCDQCGYKTNDVNVGGAVPEKGKRITITVRTTEDLSRDILKSGTCALKSKTLGLEVQPGTLGGRFTTIEGLLTQVRDQLHGQIFDISTSNSNPESESTPSLESGDSLDPASKQQWNTFFAKLDDALHAKMEFEIVLEDPMAASFVQKTADIDAQVVEEEYVRTELEEEELGLRDMRVEGYEAANEENEVMNGSAERT